MEQDDLVRICLAYQNLAARRSASGSRQRFALGRTEQTDIARVYSETKQYKIRTI